MRLSFSVLLILGIAATIVVVGFGNDRRAELLDTSMYMAAVSPGEELSGGATTVADTSRNAFGRPSMNLLSEERSRRWFRFSEGKGIFDRNWSRGASTAALGPRFTATSCNGCHVKDGRGRPPLRPGEPPTSIVMQVSIPSPDGEHALPHPAYDAQLNYHASMGAAPEGTVEVTYQDIGGSFADGELYTLDVPTYRFRDLRYGALANDVMISPRVAPANFGLGLLEAIPDDAILAGADPHDMNRDGISGRPNTVLDRASGKMMLGRFGWKANQPTIEQQIAMAFLSDMGITSELLPVDPQGAATSHPPFHPEVTPEDFELVLMYVKLLAVPGRRLVGDRKVLKGKAVFTMIGCAQCHTPSFTTGIMEGFPELSGQMIHPYSDLLLHDMGNGLSDGRPDGKATGSEWRTPPLWGIGLIDNVNNHTRFLHDGRARNLEEAILWHGGEATPAQQSYTRLNRDDRGALLAFLESL